MEKNTVDVALVSKLLKSKRGGQSLREAGKEIGVAAPTLQRLEGGQMPTASTLLKIARWLGVSIDDLGTGPKEERDTLTEIEVLLRADPDLEPDAAATIANVARQVYDGFKRKKAKNGKR